MVEFSGTVKEFKHFLGGYCRNKTQNLLRKFKSGICANCECKRGDTDSKGSKVQIDSAHKREFERDILVEKFCKESTVSGKTDLDKFDKLFTEYHSNPDNFFFLCSSCHKKYDDGEIDEKDFKYIAESKKPEKSKK